MKYKEFIYILSESNQHSVCRSGSPTAGPSGGGRRSWGTRSVLAAAAWSRAMGLPAAPCWALQGPPGPLQHRARSPGCLSTRASTACIPPYHSPAPWLMPTGQSRQSRLSPGPSRHSRRSHYSSMNSLSSMSTSCLQNRDASSYYSMFHHDPLSSLSSYGRSCGVASAQSASHMGSYGSSLTSSSSSSTSGSGSSGETPAHCHLSVLTSSPQVSSGQEWQCHCRSLVSPRTLLLTTGRDSSRQWYVVCNTWQKYEH